MDTSEDVGKYIQSTESLLFVYLEKFYINSERDIYNFYIRYVATTNKIRKWPTVEAY